jgi:hypothetical protein
VFVQKVGNKVVVAVGMVLVATSMLMLSRLGVHAGFWQVAPVTMVLGLGMSQVFAPATDSIMGSLPKEKAGVGSAMNDTTRQAGGAIGVAVLGSILASRFNHSVVSETLAHHLPATAAKHDVAGALAYAQSASGKANAAVIQTIAKSSFVDAFHFAVVLGIGIMILAMAAVLAWLPSRPVEEEIEALDMPLEVAIDVA